MKRTIEQRQVLAMAEAIKRDERKALKASRAPRVVGAKLVATPGPSTARKPSARAKLLAFIVCKGRCALCLGRFAVADMDLDHRVPLALGGDEAPSNYEMLCRSCHRAKTSKDVARIAKAKRQSQIVGPKEPSAHPIRSRGFQ